MGVLRDLKSLSMHCLLIRPASTETAEAVTVRARTVAIVNFIASFSGVMFGWENTEIERIKVRAV